MKHLPLISATLGINCDIYLLFTHCNCEYVRNLIAFAANALHFMKIKIVVEVGRTID